MSTVTASEFQKNFGTFKEAAQRNPIIITSNGRESVVLLSVEEYKEFLKFKQSQFAYDGKISDDFKNDVENFMDSHGDILDGLAK
uniref:Antitoxin n=1 Tax=Candidatus Kentrum sp. LPFa TaxID=2126335 RepID=A0A450X4R0_9GAMM|nr:MAG: prevent-host-death family protein [Candidatus Kentron sp. LPFa]